MEKDNLEQPLTAEVTEETAIEPLEQENGGNDNDDTVKDEVVAEDPQPSNNDEVAALRTENENLRNQVLRARADFENARRRTDREKQDAIRFANKRIFFELLGVMDNFERAMGASQDPEDPFTVGILMIQKQLEEVLTQNGVKEVPALNQAFDPYLHEAFAKEPSSEHPENTVIEVFQKGYKFHDQLLRPATVKVSTSADEDDV